MTNTDWADFEAVLEIAAKNNLPSIAVVPCSGFFVFEAAGADICDLVQAERDFRYYFQDTPPR